MMTVEGVLDYCAALNVDPEDKVMLVVCYHVQAPRIGEISRKGFMEGWTKLRCDSIESMRSAIPILRQQLLDDETFRKVYSYTFNFGRQEGQKSLRG